MASSHSEILNRAIRIAQKFKQTIGPLCSDLSSPPQISPPTLPSLHLEMPYEVTRELQDTTTYEELREALSRAVNGVRDDYISIYSKACSRTMTAPVPQREALTALAGVLQKRFYNQALPPLLKLHYQAKEEIRISIEAAVSIPSTSARPFNHAFIPLLQTYFIWNPFPSLADKRVLADKGLMTERQVDVWFQNRRALVRKHHSPHVLVKSTYKEKTLGKVPVPDDIWTSIMSFGRASMPDGYPSLVYAEKLAAQQSTPASVNIDGVKGSKGGLAARVGSEGVYPIGLAPTMTPSYLKAQREMQEVEEWEWSVGWGSLDNGMSSTPTAPSSSSVNNAANHDPFVNAKIPCMSMDEFTASTRAKLPTDFRAQSIFKKAPMPPAHYPHLKTTIRGRGTFKTEFTPASNNVKTQDSEELVTARRKEMREAVRDLSALFVDADKRVFGDLGVRELPSLNPSEPLKRGKSSARNNRRSENKEKTGDERVGAATASFSTDVRWYISSLRSSWTNALEKRREAKGLGGKGVAHAVGLLGRAWGMEATLEATPTSTFAVDEPIETPKTKVPRKQRLGEKRTPKNKGKRYEPYPNSNPSTTPYLAAVNSYSRNSSSPTPLRSHSSSSSLSSTFSRTPSLTCSTSSSSDEDMDMEDLFGPTVSNDQPQWFDFTQPVFDPKTLGDLALPGMGMPMIAAEMGDFSYDAAWGMGY